MLRVVQAELVATTVLRGRALDIGDPVAVVLGACGQPARYALSLHRLGVVEEPVELALGAIPTRCRRSWCGPMGGAPARGGVALVVLAVSFTGLEPA